MRTDAARNASLAGAVVSSVAASACCIGPLVFAALGLGGAGFLIALEPYRPAFTVLTVALLGIGFYTTRLTKQAAMDDCACEMPRTNRAGRWMLWGVTVLALLALAAPTLIPYIL